MESLNAAALAKELDSIDPTTLDSSFDDVTAWLARLVLLYGVPLDYLVPESAMLPENSLRFFYIDPLWIQALVQGACSIGRNGYGDTLIDQALNRRLQPANSQNGLSDRKPASVRDQLRLQYESVEMQDNQEILCWPLTGFFLRSPVVDGWRGLEITGFRNPAASATHEPLKPLRIEQLADDIMFGLFNGTVDQLVIRQPQESLHFGLTRQGNGYAKTLRELGYHNPPASWQTLDRSKRDDRSGVR
ncbi:MAG: hypothetical protein BVN35_08130 [Proteobacteria bacterium ST_bin11]|nr:MAG: hypothetical protein BVN35_08130 [Proteobacteria bacterium ST_bin11]